MKINFKLSIQLVGGSLINHRIIILYFINVMLIQLPLISTHIFGKEHS